jgi:hypothetical protein
MEIDRRDLLMTGLAAAASLRQGFGGLAPASLPPEALAFAGAEVAESVPVLPEPVPEEDFALMRTAGVCEVERQMDVPMRFVYPANHGQGVPVACASFCLRRWQAHESAPYVCRGFLRVPGPPPEVPLDDDGLPLTA